MNKYYMVYPEPSTMTGLLGLWEVIYKREYYFVTSPWSYYDLYEHKEIRVTPQDDDP